MLENVLPMASSGHFMVSCLIFKSLSQFKFIVMVPGVRECSYFTDLHDCLASAAPLAEEASLLCIECSGLLC